MKFVYNTFLDYYDYRKNPTNVLIDTNAAPTTIYHYKTGINKNKYSKKVKLVGKQLPSEYILIGGKKVYVTILSPDRSPYERILFTIPTTINGVLWDFHYNFSIRDDFSSRMTTKDGTTHNVVAFHKTIQNPGIGKEESKCYFLEDDDITEISEIDCIVDKDTKMTTNFPMDTEDFTLIKEIIQRPFVVSQPGGRRRKNRTKRVRHIRSVTKKRRSMRRR